MQLPSSDDESAMSVTNSFTQEPLDYGSEDESEFGKKR